MQRILFWFALAFVVSAALGCASADPGDAPAPHEMIGSSHSALGTPLEYSVSTRSPVSDNTQILSTATVGAPGVVSSGNEGLCWFKAISGSFRAANEYATILKNNTTGYYGAAVKSRTIDSVTGVGPAMTMRCRHLTDFMPAAMVTDYAVNYRSISADLVGWSTPPRRSAVTNTTASSAWPWAGLDGRLQTAANPLYAASKADRSSNYVYISIATDCPYAAVDCAMSSTAWQTYDTTGTHAAWAYTMAGTTANNTADVTLVSSSSYECFIDGINGEWKSNTSASIYSNQSDGKWHLSTAAGSSGGMAARASCIALSQF